MLSNQLVISRRSSCCEFFKCNVCHRYKIDPLYSREGTSVQLISPKQHQHINLYVKRKMCVSWFLGWTVPLNVSVLFSQSALLIQRVPASDWCLQRRPAHIPSLLLLLYAGLHFRLQHIKPVQRLILCCSEAWRNIKTKSLMLRSRANAS